MTAAADYAAALMRAGYDPRDAILTAAGELGVGYSAVAAVLGRRGGRATRRRQELEQAFGWLLPAAGTGPK